MSENQARLIILNNLAYTECQAGEFEAATSAAERLLGLFEKYDLVLDDSTRDTVAKVWLATGRHAEAITLLRPADKAYDNQFEEANSVASCLVTLAEAHRTAGDLDRAGAALRVSTAGTLSRR